MNDIVLLKSTGYSAVVLFQGETLTVAFGRTLTGKKMGSIDIEKPFKLDVVVGEKQIKVVREVFDSELTDKQKEKKFLKIAMKLTGKYMAMHPDWLFGFIAQVVDEAERNAVSDYQIELQKFLGLRRC